MTRSEMVKEILQLQKELGIKRNAEYYFSFSNSKVKSMLNRTRTKLLTYLEKEGVL